MSYWYSHMALLNELRERQGKTQAEVASDLETSLSTLNRHEQGKIRLSKHHRLAYGCYYGVDPDSIEQPSRKTTGEGAA